MRQIKFKAKRLNNNTWVEGYFYAECGNTYIIEDRQSESMLNRKACCGNCLWMGCEDILGNGWCYKKDCETSCDKVCKKHEF